MLQHSGHGEGLEKLQGYKTWLCLGDSHVDDKSPGPITKVRSFLKCTTVAQSKNPQDFSDVLFSSLALP